jgi:radical SAM superfamily enzyme
MEGGKVNIQCVLCLHNHSLHVINIHRLLRDYQRQAAIVLSKNQYISARIPFVENIHMK